jgi:Arc/MetJ-type ribon-helix-helix transcriptional regulator
MTLNLPTDVANALTSQVASGAFASTEDALRAAVKLLGEESARKQRLERFRETLREADQQIERGEFYDVDEVFDELEVELFGRKLAQT